MGFRIQRALLAVSENGRLGDTKTCVVYPQTYGRRGLGQRRVNHFDMLVVPVATLPFLSWFRFPSHPIVSIFWLSGEKLVHLDGRRLDVCPRDSLGS